MIDQPQETEGDGDGTESPSTSGGSTARWKSIGEHSRHDVIVTQSNRSPESASGIFYATLRKKQFKNFCQNVLASLVAAFLAGAFGLVVATSENSSPEPVPETPNCQPMHHDISLPGLGPTSSLPPRLPGLTPYTC